MIQVVFSLHKTEEPGIFIFGKKGPSSMLWSNPNDLKKFKEVTTSQKSQNILLMGSSTFKSLKTILPNRAHFVLSSKGNDKLESIKTQDGKTPHYVISSIDEFKELQHNLPENSTVSIIGGFEVIKQFIENQYIHIHDENCNHDSYEEYNPREYEIVDVYITILGGEFNSTGELIKVNQSELNELLQNYSLLEIQHLDENTQLYHYKKK